MFAVSMFAIISLFEGVIEARGPPEMGCNARVLGKCSTVRWEFDDLK